MINWPIHRKELFALVLSAGVFGHTWSGKRICFQCDNKAAADAVVNGLTRDRSLMPLLRALWRFSLLHNFKFTAQHYPGELNTVADALSRDRIDDFRVLHPDADPWPMPIPPLRLLCLA
jgi:DNA polymerase III delta prime subunit